MRIKHKARGKAFIIIGLILVILSGALYYANLSEDKKAEEASAELLQEMSSDKTEDANVCGTLTIGKLDIMLPVLAQWSEYGLTQAPCRYTGSAQTCDMIIAGHNYNSHFGRLKELSYGDTVEFTDSIGKRYIYYVKEITTLDGTAVSDMKAGEWDLTLFTCTKGGKQRVTIRCSNERIE